MRVVGCVLILMGVVTGAAADLVLAPGQTEIVVSANAAKAVPFAAAELNGIWTQAFGEALPVVTAPTLGKASICLGDSPWSRAAGISTNTLVRDAFVIRVSGSRLFIVGRDDNRYDLARDFVGKGRTLMCEHATLFGVYEFLERFAGVRFYFPGEMGTIVPKLASVRVPENTDLAIAPNFTVRNIYLQGDGAVPNETNQLARNSWKALDWLRLRLQTTSIPCCHGQRGFKFPERFHKTHPEYFALVTREGKLVRDVGAHQVADCDAQMCHSSAIWDEMYLDCKAYLSGAKAEVRGIPNHWRPNTFGWNNNCQGKYIDVMAQDGMCECQCPNCQKAYDKSTGNFATELIWGNTAKLANRLKADGFSDFALTQMAYPPYRDVPKCALPPEIQVMVAEMGPWGVAYPGKTESELVEVRAWTQKLGHKIWMWTYPSKFGHKATPGVPDMAPRAWATYYKATVPYSFGAFCESECEQSIFHYLNYYVFSRMAWNPDVDVEALLAEHFRLMFGAAAPEMAAFYTDLEKKWTTQVLHSWRKTRDGMDFTVATDFQLWREIYTAQVRADWAALFDRAARKVEGDAGAAKRLAFIRHAFLDYMNAVADPFLAALDPERGRARYAAIPEGKNLFPKMTKPVHLMSTNAAVASVHTYPLKGKIKPNTKYRISGVFKLKNVVRYDGPRVGGCWFDGYVGDWQWFPRVGGVFTGTHDWVYREYEFTTPAVLGIKTAPYMGFVMNRATGEAWIECLALEEIDSVCVANDPSDYKPTVSRHVRPVKIVDLESSAKLVDFGKEAFGYLEFTPPAGTRGKYEVWLGELLTADGHVNRKPGATIRAAKVCGEITADGVHRVPLVADKRNTRGGTEGGAIPIPPRYGVIMPFRYVEVAHAPFPITPQTVRMVAINYPMNLSASSFTCDCPALVQVYDFCKYSILATSFAGIYVDGDRERIPYEADAYLNQLGEYAVHADYALARASMEYLCAHPTWPTEWRQHSIKMAWADWMWTGDTRFIAKHYDYLKNTCLLLPFARADGLIVSGGERMRGKLTNARGLADIVDWPACERDGFVFCDVNAVVNAFHYRNLLEMADMARALGKEADVRFFTARAQQVYASYQKVFFAQQTELYHDGEGTEHTSLHAQVAALAFGLVPQQYVAKIVTHCGQRDLACSVYFAQYLLEAFCLGNRPDLALRAMTKKGDRSWLDMLEQGATITMEAWAPKYKPNLDLNHAWGAAPLNIISRFILGVTPLEPGCTKVRIAPQVGYLNDVSATVPTAKGSVRLHIVNGAVLTVDTPVPAQIVFAGKVRDVTAGHHELRP